MGEVDLFAREYRNGVIGIIDEIVSLFSDVKKAKISDYIYSYNSSKIGNIQFSLGKDHDGQMIDVNSEFREEVSYYIIANSTVQVSSELLRDIYIESGKRSQQLIGGPEYIPFIAKLLIKQTGKQFIKDFCMYLTSSFDFYGACTEIDLYDYDVNPLISAIEDLMRDCKCVETYKKLEHGREFLQRYI